MTDCKSKLETVKIYIKDDQQRWIRSLLKMYENPNTSTITSFTIPTYPLKFKVVDSIVLSEIDILTFDTNPLYQLHKEIKKLYDIVYKGATSSIKK